MSPFAAERSSHEISTASTAIITSSSATAVSVPKCIAAMIVPTPTSAMPEMPGRPNPGRKTSTRIRPMPSSTQSAIGRFSKIISIVFHPSFCSEHTIPAGRTEALLFQLYISAL